MSEKTCNILLLIATFVIVFYAGFSVGQIVADRKFKARFQGVADALAQILVDRGYRLVKEKQE